jgi:uncharacterized protein DUF5818
MRKISLSICMALALFVAAAVAQTAPRGGQGTQGSSPSMGQPGYPSSQQPGTAQPDNTMGQTDQNNPNQNRTEKSEKKLKGCLQSQGGQYVLETKKGKAIALTGQDVSAHVGHEVSVKGMWESGGGTGMSSASSGKAAGSEKTFNVSSVDMISDTCSGKSKGSSGSMGTAPSSTSPSGAGSTNPPENNPPPSNPPQNNPPESNPPQ